MIMEDKELTIMEHIKELRKLLVTSLILLSALFITLFGVSGFFLKAVVSYFAKDITIVALTPLESLGVQLSFAGIMSLIIALPLLTYNLYSFIKPTIKKEIRKKILGYIISSLFLGLIGFSLGTTFISKFLLQQMAFYSIVNPLWGIRSLFSFIFFTGLALALVLQLIIIIQVLIKLEIISIENYKKARPVLLIGSLILGAIITPPDVMSQVIMAGFMLGSMEFGVLLAKIGGKKNDRTKRDVNDWRSISGNSIVRKENFEEAYDRLFRCEEGL